MLCDNSRTAFSMAGISYQIHGIAGKQCFFLPKRLEKGWYVCFGQYDDYLDIKEWFDSLGITCF